MYLAYITTNHVQNRYVVLLWRGVYLVVGALVGGYLVVRCFGRGVTWW